MSKISVADFERKVLEQEEIVIRVKAPPGTKVKDYNYSRKAAGTMSTTDWLEGRIKPCLGGNAVDVIGGDYATPHGRTKLDTLRTSYER